ncbi:MAG: c-type cytochrome [Planctomycetaceae bacterium]|nr:c-type cytochrome [Planctomycetaceae bacterium]
MPQTLTGDAVLNPLSIPAVANVVLAFAMITAGPVAPLQAQESPEASLQSLHVADGLDVSLWASEPMVKNPTAMDIDSRGRVWIAEGLNYRMKQRSFEGMNRVDGADQIKVLSDTDGDGKADRVTVFADNIFPVPLGLAVEEVWQDGRQTGTRVYVGNSPDLLVLEDTNGDDVADKREVLLTGFRGIDSDHGLHGMTFGPDGRLYFTVGDARYGADQVQMREATFEVTDRCGRRVAADNFGTTLRVNRDGTQLEVLSSGHRNNYETAVDSFENVFGSDNDDDGNRGCRMYWVMDGGRYGYQHPRSHRHWAEELPGIIPKLAGTGNGAPCGLLVYEGDALPGVPTGSVLQIDSGTHQVNLHPVQRHGAGFRSDYKVLLKGDDAWFRPVDLAVAPDASLFVCDWYDAGVGGNRFTDQTTGRIYRVAAKETDPRVRTPESRTVEIERNPVAALRSPNNATRLAARDLLLTGGTAARLLLLDLLSNGQPHEQARALHVLAAVPETGRQDVLAALHHNDGRIREVAVQILARDAAAEYLHEAGSGHAAPPALSCLEEILSLANDPDAGVRRALLMAIRRIPTSQVEPTLRQLVAAWDGRDRYYLEAIRAAVIHRESPFVVELFGLLADVALETRWTSEAVALPPYYPTGTNDAFLRIEDELPGSNAASRLAGIAWCLQRSEAVPALQRILLAHPSAAVEQSVIMALSSISDPSAGAMLLQRLAAADVSIDAKKLMLQQLKLQLTGDWSELNTQPALQSVLAAGMQNDELREATIEVIAAGGYRNFAGELVTVVETASNDDAVRGAALIALGRLNPDVAITTARTLVSQSKGEPRAGALVLSALETLRSTESRDDLIAALQDADLPQDARRRALQLATSSAADVDRILELRKAKGIPEDLTSELTFLLHNHSDRRIRQVALTELPLQNSAGERRVHSFQSILEVQGNAERGRELFTKHQTANCARCHRTDGQGALVGPDLSSIGTKYDARELLYHVQSPSGAISYNFVASALLMKDGTVMNGLVLDRSDNTVTLGLATGQQVKIDAATIEDETPQAVSIMPEGLIAGLTTQEAADLIEYLQSLRQGDAVLQR